MKIIPPRRSMISIHILCVVRCDSVQTEKCDFVPKIMTKLLVSAAARNHVSKSFPNASSESDLARYHAAIWADPRRDRKSPSLSNVASDSLRHKVGNPNYPISQYTHALNFSRQTQTLFFLPALVCGGALLRWQTNIFTSFSTMFLPAHSLLQNKPQR